MTSVVATTSPLRQHSFGSAMPAWQSSRNKDSLASLSPPPLLHHQPQPLPKLLGLRRRNASKRICLSKDETSHLYRKTSQANRPTRAVHFSEQPAAEHTIVRDASVDKSELWWTREDYVQFEAANRQTYYQCYDSPDAERLQQLYHQCWREAAGRRGSGTSNTARRSSSVALSTQPLTLDCRGLEATLIPGLSQRRRAAIDGVLNAQANVAPSSASGMKQRIISKTAAHLSRASVHFALQMAQMDAQEVLETEEEELQC